MAWHTSVFRVSEIKVWTVEMSSGAIGGRGLGSSFRTSGLGGSGGEGWLGVFPPLPCSLHPSWDREWEFGKGVGKGVGKRGLVSGGQPHAFCSHFGKESLVSGKGVFSHCHATTRIP